MQIAGRGDGTTMLIGVSITLFASAAPSPDGRTNSHLFMLKHQDRKEGEIDDEINNFSSNEN